MFILLIMNEFLLWGGEFRSLSGEGVGCMNPETPRK